MAYQIILAFSIMLWCSGVRMQAVIERLSLPDGAICGQKIPAYLVIDSHKLLSDDKLFYEDVDEEECKIICSDNKDDRGVNILCGSFHYNVKTRLCSINRGKAVPAGKLQLKRASGHRYYEKICLPDGSPSTCGDAAFFRANQAVLVGYAKNVTTPERLSDCIDRCVTSKVECKSAMFFPGTKECIINSATAQGAPDAFIEEVEENGVVYFENGCTVGDQIRTQKAIGSPSKKNSAAQEAKAAGIKRPTSDEEESSSASATSTDRVASSGAGDKDDTEDTSVTARGLLSPRPSTPEGEEEPGQDEFGPWSRWSRCDRADGRRVRKRKCGKGKRCRGLKIESQWCSEIDPSELQAPVLASSTAEEEEGDLLDASQEAGIEPDTTARPSRRPKITRQPRPQTSTGAVTLAGDIWTPWSDECRQFDEPNACRSGTRLGFQMRQCLRSPFECQGTFFRYCIVPC